MREMRQNFSAPSNDFANFGRAKLLRYVLASLITGLGTAFIGPFGTYDILYAGPRYLFWITTVSLGWAQMLLISYAVRGFVARGKLHGWPTLLIAAALGTIPILFEVRFLAVLFLAENATLAPLWLGYINVFILTLMFSLVQWLVVEKWPLFPTISEPTSEVSAQPVANAETDNDIAEQAFRNKGARLSRMPDGLEGDILCLQTEDHYLCVFTEEGKGLVLQRLSDALIELEPFDGMQVHRSWWVAHRAITGSRTVKRQKFLLLSNGLEVPVSRTYLASVKAAGWI